MKAETIVEKRYGRSRCDGACPNPSTWGSEAGGLL